MYNTYTGPSLSDIAAVSGSRDGGGDMFGGGGAAAAVLIILFAIFGFGRNGNGLFGGGGGDNGGGSCCAPASCADLQRGFDSNMAQQRFNGIDQGLCSTAYENAQLIATVNQNLNTGFAGIQNNINQGFAGIQNSMNQGFAGLNTGLMQQGYETRLATQGVQAQLAQCCCDTGQLIQANTTQGVMNTNAIQQQIQNCCCDVEKMNMQTRFDAQQNQCATIQAIDKLGDRIEARMVAQELANKDNVINDLRQQLNSKDRDSALFEQSQYLVNQIRPCPSPSYVVPNPYCCNTYYGNGYNNGCGNGYNGCC